MKVGEIEDSAAAAIDGAAVVLLCFSDAYKKSKRCRLEAIYAGTKNKKILPVRIESDYVPDDWLGFALGNEIYLDCSNMTNRNDCKLELMAHLCKMGVDAKFEPGIHVFSSILGKIVGKIIRKIVSKIVNKIIRKIVGKIRQSNFTHVPWLNFY